MQQSGLSANIHSVVPLNFKGAYSSSWLPSGNLKMEVEVVITQFSTTPSAVLEYTVT